MTTLIPSAGRARSVIGLAHLVTIPQPWRAASAARPARGASTGDDAEDELRGNSLEARARRRERARCAAIFASPAAARNLVLAANLAFKTRAPRREAIALLEARAGGETAPAGNQTKVDRSGRTWDAAFAALKRGKR